MKIRGLQRLTMLDYPGLLACIIFLGGCNFRCPYCHNPEMIDPNDDTFPEILHEDVLEFLRTRVGKLDGVVISGGEPTLWSSELPDFIREIRDLGFKVKLDTNGTNPELLEKLYKENLLDYIAMDIKASPEHYEEIVKYADVAKIQKSIGLIMNSGVDYEFRSTILPALHDEAEVEAMGQMIAGAKKYYLQTFRPDKTLDPKFNLERAFTTVEMHQMCKYAQKNVPNAELRD